MPDTRSDNLVCGNSPQRTQADKKDTGARKPFLAGFTNRSESDLTRISVI
jgi:hypothetical protein